jgi:hypothetical protein
MINIAIALPRGDPVSVISHRATGTPLTQHFAYEPEDCLSGAVQIALRNSSEKAAILVLEKCGF